MEDMVSILADPGSLETSSCSASSRRKCLESLSHFGALGAIWATVNIWYIVAPSHQFLKRVLLFSQPQLNFQK